MGAKKEDRAKAIDTAKRWVDNECLFVDTETTGTGSGAEICDIAFVNMRGETVFDSLVRPTIRIPDVVINIHHITNEMVKDAPTFDQILDQVMEICAGKLVIAYNMAFDARMIEQSALARGWALTSEHEKLRCAMLLYAAFVGQWNSYRCGYKWHKLALAAEQCGVPIVGTLHRARADADLGRQIVLHMANSIT